jgi:ATP/maltotriose-dependent transcriptional regulator MalT/DNA-binding SARP family transcriptional activator
VSTDSPAATETTRLRPPAPPPTLLPREHLRELLGSALTRRLTTVVADAGFGKSTLLAAWADEVNCAWLTASPDDASLPALARSLADALRLRVPSLPAEAARALVSTGGPGMEDDELARARGFAAVVCESLQAGLRRDLVLVVDDVHEVFGSPGAVQLIDALCRQAPSRLHLVLASRAELPFPIERLRGQGLVLELSSPELAFDAQETAALLAVHVEPGDAATAAVLQEATGGWPAAVRLAVEALRGLPAEDQPAALRTIGRPGGPLLGYLASEVFAHEPPEVAELVSTVAPLDRFSAELCDALGVEHADEQLRSLARRGLLVELQGKEGAWYTLGAPVREYAHALPKAPDEARDVQRRAADWFLARDDPLEALRCLTSAGDRDGIISLLEAHGHSLLAHGSVDAVLDAVERVEPAQRSAAIDEVAGEAFQIRGAWDEALRCFDRAAGTSEPLPAGLAWRMGLLHYLGGRLDEAIETFDRAGEHGEPADVGLLLGWRATVHWIRGDGEACRADAERAFAVASAARDDRALAAAHTVLAMLAALEGDRSANEAHYLRALEYAEKAEDVLQLIRVRTNRGSRHLEEGSYEEAIAELDLALRLADLAGFAAFRALALTNRGQALASLGRFEEAVADLDAAYELYQRLGSRMVAYPLGRLGEVYLARGEWTLARAAFEEGISHAEPAGDAQGLVPALVGLARVLAADEPDTANGLIERALSFGPGMGHVGALAGAAWVALAHDDARRAAALAEEAASVAGIRRDRGALAESLELRVLAADDRSSERGRLREARELWAQLGNPVGVARIELLDALLTDDDEAAHKAEERLRAFGVRGEPASLVSRRRAAPVVVETLGRFRVLCDGQPLQPSAWQSRKARDLLKILVAREGRPTPREMLMETLWPGQSPGPLGNRLSVLLSTVRGVLDPGKRFGPDHFVAADKTSLWLELDHVEIDVRRFATRARAALDARRARSPRALAQLAAAEQLYSGDFLEEDAYEDWAVALREEARALYTELARALADDSAAAGDLESAARYYRRILERDTYDERAHLGLVAALESAGQHGEARRSYRAYCGRMDVIGAEPSPFPRTAATTQALL